ncbi:MAG: hypothetical protein JW955_23595 [Sedimentisphaerales bacterium]|nr:hypothetical protein [Sedimentisphaerales bacterium]
MRWMLWLWSVCCLCTHVEAAQQTYVDRPFVQDFSEKVPLAPSVGNAELRKVRADRNGRICVLSDKGLLQVHEGRLVPERLHRPLADMHIVDIETQDGQFVYVTDEFILSNAGAGKLHVPNPASEDERRDANSLKPIAASERRLPSTDIRCTRVIGKRTWFGTPDGAVALHPDGRIDYYASRRWLVDDDVVDIQPGPDDAVLVLTRKGLNIIRFKEMTLAEKATHFDRIMRQRHIRYGFNSALVMSEPGDLSTASLIDTDNDGLWTAMYLAGELFRYAVTKSDEALHNCYESFEAMERLSEITPMEGFPARSFERAGYQVSDKSRWQPAQDKRWVWKATTSSDEIVGHFFAYTIFAEIVPDKVWRDRAVALMDAIMAHIVRNDWYLVDYDGKPTQWGRWNPEYVNQFPRQVGDRRLNSAEIISFLQAANHFTGKDLYKQKAFELFDKYGYLDNIMIPIKELSRVPGIDLTTEWNHSDDELAFLTYWNLYRYAFTDELREKYRGAIKEHWEIERPEKNPLWDFIYADTGAREFDLEESIWTLKEFPLDTISWTVHNSRRKDLEFLGPNFRQQTTRVVLPPDERPMSKHNGNAFDLDGGNGGREEFAPDIYLLPYWLGRHLGVIR